jgi:hypothetical protein
MRIRPDELVAGFSAKQIRELLRQNDQYLSAIHVGKVLGLKGKKALKLLETLERKGYIEKSETDSDAMQYWKLTLWGSALSKALFSAPVSRRNAEKKLIEFMERVHQVNEDGRFLYRVRKVIVFGSCCPKHVEPIKHSKAITNCLGFNIRSPLYFFRSFMRFLQNWARGARFGCEFPSGWFNHA